MNTQDSRPHRLSSALAGAVKSCGLKSCVGSIPTRATKKIIYGKTKNYFSNNSNSKKYQTAF